VKQRRVIDEITGLIQPKTNKVAIRGKTKHNTSLCPYKEFYKA